MKKLYLHIISFLFLLIPINTYCQSGEAKSLKIGNKWIYLFSISSFSNYESFEVIRDTIINSTDYAVIIDSSLYPSFISRIIIERADSNKIYEYHSESGNEFAVVDFNLEIGDTIFSSEVTSKEYVNIFGESLIKLCLYFDGGYYWTNKCYIEKLGLVWEEGDGTPTPYYSHELEAANINGQIYGDTTLLDVDDTGILPNEFQLSQNYPNPFNPSTTIKYSIPNAGLITIKVYDVLGKEIATLVNEEKPAGNYEVEFSATGGGRNLPSGIYFYQLKAGNFVETKKMVLLK